MSAVGQLIVVGFAILSGDTAISEWRGRSRFPAAKTGPLQLFARRAVVVNEFILLVVVVGIFISAAWAQALCGLLLIFIGLPLLISVWRFGRPRFLIPPPVR